MLQDVNPDLAQFIEQISLAMDHHPDIVFIKDINLRYVYVNESYRQRRNLSNVIGKTDSEVFPQEKQQLFHNTDMAVLSSRKDVRYEINNEVDNVTYHVIMIKSPILDQKGNVIGLLGTGRDYSELFDAREFVEILVNTIPYPILIKDLQYKYIKINDAYCNDLGLTKSEILGKTDSELFGEENSRFYRQKDKQVIETGSRVMYLSQGVDPVRRVQPEKRYMTIKDPLRSASGEIIGIVGIVNPYVDITEYQEQIINQQRIESLSSLAGGIAHDLNNMLTSVVGLSSIMLEDEADDTKHKMLATIYNSSRNAAKLIEKLLTFSKQTQEKFVELDLKMEVITVLELVKSTYSTEMEFEIQLCAEPLPIMADKTQVSQLAMNLLINAAEAMNNKGKIRIELSSTKKEDLSTNFLFQPSQMDADKYAHFSIKDEGPGIDPTILSQVFDPYFSTKENGTGLGLSIVYGVLTAHHGLMGLNTSSSGTTFEIYLPMIPSAL